MSEKERERESVVWCVMICSAGEKLNPQHAPSVDQDVLARETEQLARE